MRRGTTTYELDVLPERPERDPVPAATGDVFDEEVCRVLRTCEMSWCEGNRSGLYAYPLDC